MVKAIGASWNHKNWSRRLSDIPGTVLESSERILSLSKKIFEILHFLEPERYSLILSPKTQHGYLLTVLVPKRHQNLKFCWCNFNFWKVWTVSFPKPVSEYPLDVWLWFYVFLKFGKNGQKIGGDRKKKSSQLLILFSKKIAYTGQVISLSTQKYSCLSLSSIAVPAMFREFWQLFFLSIFRKTAGTAFLEASKNAYFLQVSLTTCPVYGIFPTQNK